MPVSSEEAFFWFKNKLAIWQKTLLKLNQAINLLYANYENQLNLDSFVNAMNLFGNKQKASMFLVMKPGDKRD